MRLEFHPDALAEYRAAAVYYESRRPDLGIRFIDAVEDAIRRIAESPIGWRVIDEDVRRCMTHVFPRRSGCMKRLELVRHLESLRLLAGDLPPRVLGLVAEWAQMHRSELAANWTLLAKEGKFNPIAPLV